MQKYINIWCEMVAILVDFINTPKIKNAFLWGIVFYGIALFALIRGDIYYADDWRNSVNGGVWNHNRYLATFILSYVATIGKGAIDLSPLPQILGACLAVISSLILVYLIRKKFDLISILASLPLGLSPHFLQNLSYKFDSLTMGFALFCVIMPFLFKENRRIFIAVSIISLFCMLMTYQAANATYIILSLYFAFSAYFLENRSFKDSAIFLAICAMNLIMASLIFMLFTNDTNYGDAYVSNAMIALNIHFFAGIWANLSTYLTTIFNDLKQTPYIWLVALMSVLFVISVVIRTNRNKIATIFSAILFLLLSICLSYGLYLVLQKPLFEPRAFYGFNAFVAILCIANSSRSDFLGSASSRSLQRTPSASHSLVSHNPKNSSTILEFAPNIESAKFAIDSRTIHKIFYFISAAIAVITAYFLISFANIYGNALKKQDEYLDFRNDLLLRDLGKVVPKSGEVMLYVETFINANHPVAQRFIDKYGDISRIIPKLYMLTHFADGYNYDLDGLCISGQFSGEVVLKNAYHTIKRVKSCYIVTQN